MNPNAPQPEWNHQYQRHLYLQFNSQYQRWYWDHYEGNESPWKARALINGHQDKVGCSSPGSLWILRPLSHRRCNPSYKPSCNPNFNLTSMSTIPFQLLNITASTLQPGHPAIAKVQQSLALTTGETHCLPVITNTLILVSHQYTVYHIRELMPSSFLRQRCGLLH